MYTFVNMTIPRARRAAKVKKVKAVPADKEPLPHDLQAILNAMDEREKLYADNFVHTLNKRKAAIAALYPAHQASSKGLELYRRPQVKAYIDYVINSSISAPSENTKLIQSIRDTSINDYLTPVQRVKYDMIEVPLQQIIDGAKKELDLENEYYIDYAADPEEETYCLKKIAGLKRQIGKYEIELRLNPAATRIIRGPDYLYTDVELDLLKLAHDQEHGKIKSFKVTKDGPQIELYSALDAANTLAKILGSDLSGQPITQVNVGATPEQLAKLTEEDLKAMAAIERKMRT